MGVGAGVGLAATLLAACACALTSGAGHSGTEEATERVLIVGAAAPGGAHVGTALASVACAALERVGVHARVAEPRAWAAAGECTRPDRQGCVEAALRALVRGEVHVALVSLGARAPPAPRLRDAGVEELGDAAPPTRRGCFAVGGGDGGPARSLLDLAAPHFAAPYLIDDSDLDVAMSSLQFDMRVPLAQSEYYCGILKDCTKCNKTHAEQCENGGPSCATILVDNEQEAALIASVACQWGLHARVRHLGANLLLAARALLAAAPARGLLLCVPEGNVPLAARPLGPPPCTTDDCPFETRRLVKLVNARRLAHELTAYRVLARIALDEPQIRELTTNALAVGPESAAQAFVAARPNWAGPPREVRVAVMVPATTAREAFDAGALRAAAELAELDANDESSVRFKVELVDDGCAAPLAFKYLTDALGAEYGALSGVVGPACGAAFADVARQSVALRLPLLAYTAQAVPDGAAGALALLAAARRARSTCRSCAPTCSSTANSLPTETELTGICDTAAAHLSIAPAWLASWDPATSASRRRWAARWQVACTHAGSAPSTCERAPAHAAVLYDALRLWAAALQRLLAARSTALDDLHRGNLSESIVEDATRTGFIGLTGEFQWTTVEGTRTRSDELVVQQWNGDGAAEVGRWVGGTLSLREGTLRWRTADGRLPSDGGERCALRSLAALLGGDCRAAFVVVASLAMSLLLVALAGGAWYCRRRAAHEHRARLAELGLRDLAPKPATLDRWEVPRERVVINRKLGTGAFGTVYGGHALLGRDRGWTAVAVKTLKVGAPTEEKLDFLSEAETMKRFDHRNVVQLLAVITHTEPVCTVMEFMLYGDLKSYLLARRHLAGTGEVSAARLTGMALDAARALSYLAHLRYVHRDVAARNCLVGASRVVKLADFGMTRVVYESDYYRFSRKGLLPVRWMAPESLALGVFSPASDVWSFGVLLYEIVTFGALPFQGLSNAEVLARVKAGRALCLPPGLRPPLEGLIKSCWHRERRARPSAAAVAAFLADSPRLLAPCADVPLDALALDEPHAEALAAPSPPSAVTDMTDLSTGATDSDRFLS